MRTEHDRMHRGSGCGCDDTTWCGDALAVIDPGCDRPGSICYRCLVHDPHEHNHLPTWRRRALAGLGVDKDLGGTR